MSDRQARMHIALIVPGGVDRSGRERVIPVLLALIERLSRRHEVLVIALEQEPEPCSYDLRGARVVNVGTGEKNVASRVTPQQSSGAPRRLPGVTLLRRFGRLMATLRRPGPRFDVLHAFWLGPTSTLALLAGRLLRIPVVVSIGGGELVWMPQIGYGSQGRWTGRLHNTLALRYAQAVTAGSHYVRHLLAHRRPDACWMPLGSAVEPLLGSVERSPGPPWRLLHVASINAVKDQATLLRAVRIVAEHLALRSDAAGAIDRHSSLIILDWVGEDTLGGRMQQMAADLGLSDIVRFHGFQPADSLMPLYRQAHLYVQSSLHESQGVAVCEAAAAGVPTVGTAVGLVAELAPTAAWAVLVGDAQALAQGILTLLHDQGQRERIGHAAQAWARAHDADWTVGAFERLYHQLQGNACAKQLVRFQRRG